MKSMERSDGFMSGLETLRSSREFPAIALGD